MDLRTEKGKIITLKSDLIRISDTEYTIYSQTTKRKYNLIYTDSFWVCDCADHKFRHVRCKHIQAIEYSLMKREDKRRENVVKIVPLKDVTCPNCDSDNAVKQGLRKNKHQTIQRFSCKDCGKKFTMNRGFEGMSATPKIITSALQLYFSGESLRGVQKFIRLQGVTVSHQTVFKWIKKYITLLKNHLDKITPMVGDAWRADEVYVKIKGDMKYLFALIDDETRFLISKEVADKKEGHDASNLFKMAKETAGTKPKVIITDGLGSYDQAYQKEYWAVRRPDRTIHIRHIHLQGDLENNKMERWNGSFRDREKVVRGLKKKDSVMFDGYQIYYNYIREHMALDNKTPAEACGIKIEGNNKWETLIQNAA